ncbi:unnamed protein product [Angiostrongylus costaricensis]|uniref:Uncharacterized protein n=1 Tax=Angiostrongylus costaricensis TaxID=334426 RepID=A0A0R3PC77_ANGCS|nr:unnamed protein product [Angiostrongylus costaricensis]
MTTLKNACSSPVSLVVNKYLIITVCCPLLSQLTLPRRAPSSTNFQQCSILRRVSSTCPVDGFIFCDAAPDTNVNQYFSPLHHNHYRSENTTAKCGVLIEVKVFCLNGVWVARTAPNAITNVTISQVCN